MSGDVRLDLGRRQRLGMVEAVWGEHKSADQITAVMLGLHQAGELALVTRVSAEKAAEVLLLFNCLDWKTKQHQWRI